MMNDAFMQYLADIVPVNLEGQLFEEIQERVQIKIKALSDDELMEHYNYVKERSDALLKRHEEEHREGGAQ